MVGVEEKGAIQVDLRVEWEWFEQVLVALGLPLVFELFSVELTLMIIRIIVSPSLISSSPRVLRSSRCFPLKISFCVSISNLNFSSAFSLRNATVVVSVQSTWRISPLTVFMEIFIYKEQLG